MAKKSNGGSRPNADLPPSASAPWTRGEATYLTGRAHLDQLDALAHEMERKWGCGRLRLLVPPDLAVKFDTQRVKLNRACARGTLDEVILEAQRMANGWRALDKAAEVAGKTCLSPLIWEVTLPDGSVAAIVHDSFEAHPTAQLEPEGRKMIVYDLQELAHLLAGYPGLARIKQEIPGAKVERVGPITDPLHGLKDFDDEIPW